MSDKIFWREKGVKQWREGWIVRNDGRKVQIGPYNGASHGIWYDREDIEIERRS